MGGQGKSVLREASQKKVSFGTKSQMWVGAVGWSQTLINYCFYGIFDPLFVENFRQIHFLCPKSHFLSPKSMGWVVLSQIKPPICEASLTVLSVQFMHARFVLGMQVFILARVEKVESRLFGRCVILRPQVLVVGRSA